ncbi:MAG: EAL domain-containing protein [Gammaproteobacteria bacterium]|nr:EAL domain-containing protein [Gammaproteobacteria bacterium]
MTQIMLVEPSPTLRFGLNRLLQNAGYQVDPLDKYQELLSRVNQHFTPPDLLIIGWPTRDKSAQLRIISSINRPEYLRVPVIIFARTMSESNLEALSQRPKVAIQLWSQYQSSLSRIEKMIDKDATAPTANPAAAFKVLLVDDSKSVRTVYGRQLTKMGLQVTLAEDADDAWQKFQEQRFDIAIIDYFMPGDNGAMLCEKIVQSGAFAHTILAILTGTYKEDIISECINAGARECMFKNESMALFNARITAMVKQLQSNVKLDQQNRDLVNILTSIGEGIYGVDPQGRITFINPTGLDILRYESQQQVIGQLAHQLFHHCDEYGRPISDETNYLYQAYLLQDSLKDWEAIFQTADKTPIHVECTIQPLARGSQKSSGSVVVFKNISERKLIEDEINWQLNHDHLTQLLNRTYFERLLQQEIQTVQVSNIISAVLYIDLDNFKQINDQAGHSAGDQLLILISEKIRSRLRHRDLAARLGGDEFAVLLHDIKYDALENLADVFREVLANTHFSYQGQEFPVSGSVGVVAISEQVTDLKTLLISADRACSMAKQSGKNQIYIASLNYEKRSEETLTSGWKMRLKTALSDNQFRLLYQPIYAAKDIYQLLSKHPNKKQFSFSEQLSPAQYECLIRLQDDDGKLLSANAFLSDAERFDLIADIDSWVIENVFKMVQNKNLSATININVSAHTLISTATVERLIEQAKAIPERCRNQIQFELKEHHVLHYRDSLMTVTQTLAELGFKFQIDDFGRNFSLFSRLRELPINAIKIDGLFTANIAWDPIDKKLLHSMIEVARTSDIATCVKAIESLDALRHIEHGGVDFIQGYLLGKPLERLK